MLKYLLMLIIVPTVLWIILPTHSSLFVFFGFPMDGVHALIAQFADMVKVIASFGDHFLISGLTINLFRFIFMWEFSEAIIKLFRHFNQHAS